MQERRIVVTVDQLDDKLVARLRRTILRILQRESPITRTQLSVQVRPHSEYWDIVLDDLIDRGIVIREAVIKDNGRAAVSYKLDHATSDAVLEGGFGEMTPEEVSTWVAQQAVLPNAASA